MYQIRSDVGKSSRKTSGRISELHEEIMQEILTRISADDLRSCVQVCRCWKDMLQSQEFASQWKRRAAGEGGAVLLVRKQGPNKTSHEQWILSSEGSLACKVPCYFPPDLELHCISKELACGHLENSRVGELVVLNLVTQALIRLPRLETKRRYKENLRATLVVNEDLTFKVHVILGRGFCLEKSAVLDSENEKWEWGTLDQKLTFSGIDSRIPVPVRKTRSEQLSDEWFFPWEGHQMLAYADSNATDTEVRLGVMRLDGGKWKSLLDLPTKGALRSLNLLVTDKWLFVVVSSKMMVFSLQSLTVTNWIPLDESETVLTVFRMEQPCKLL